MRHVLSEYRKQIGVSFAASALAGAAVLLTAGETELVGALLAGEAAAVLYFWQLARRLLRAAQIGAGGTSQVQMGLAVMLVLLGAVLWAAATAGTRHFFAAAGGFLLLHAVMMTRMICRTVRSDKRDR